MIYVTADIGQKGYAGHFARLYALALQRTGRPIWAMWHGSHPTQPSTIEPEFSSILELSSTLGKDGELRELLPAHAVIRIGGPKEVLAQLMKERGPYNVAVTYWYSDSLPKRLARRLGQFDEVWVSDELQRDALEGSGVANVRVVPFPLAHVPGSEGGKPGQHEHKQHKHKQHLFYTIGKWEGWDNCRATLDAYLSAFSRKDKVKLLLCCPDAPFENKEDVERYALALEVIDIPQLSIVKGVPSTWAELVARHASGTTYVHSSHYVCDPLDAQLARSLGKSVAQCSRVLEEIPRALAYAPYLPPQQWAAVDIRALGESMRAHYEQSQKWFSGKPKREQIGDDVVDTIGAVIDLWDTALAPAPPKPVVAAVNGRPPPSMAIIIPHKDRGADAIEPTLASIFPQLGPVDELIVSDQGSSPDVYEGIEELCRRYRATLVADWQYEGEWSIARARNVGLDWAQTTAEWVWCLDGDLIVPPGFLDALKHRIAHNPDSGIAPRVLELESPVSVKEARDFLPPTTTLGERVGSGVSALPFVLLREERGWDEWFSGYGSEDIDLLFRLRGKREFEVVPWLDGPALYHQPHEARHVGASKNLQRSMARMNGELGWEANQDGWAVGGERVLVRGAEIE